MSKETLDWLNSNTLIGFTEKRGKAWHYREGADNHFEGAVPVEEVRRRLFSWEPTSLPIYIKVDGEFQEVPSTQAIARPDNHHVMGVFTDGYVPHSYNEWLLRNVETILDEGLAIGSAGLLKRGAQAWVSVEVPDTLKTPEGVEFRPNLLAVTSLDGSIATTYKRVVTNVVCDNTMAAGLDESGQHWKAKHTRNSQVRILKAREALNIVHDVAEDFEAEVKELTAIAVSASDWDNFLEATAPTKDKEKNALTLAVSKQSALRELWESDERVAPWAGTAWGVVQAVNTFTHHGQTVRNVSRAERNMSRAITNRVESLDAQTMTKLKSVMA